MSLHVPSSYFRWVWLLVLTVLALIGISTYNSEHTGTWFFVVMLLALPVRVICGMLVPPRFERGPGRAGIPFIGWYLICCAFIFLYWTGWGWLHVLLGASKDEVQENLNFFSLPLGMVFRGFVLTPQRSFVDLCGILFANCFFYALALYLLYRFGGFLIRRDRVTRMDLFTNPVSEQVELEDD
jgi:hypothetical protein